jgi:hypothetical protein
MLAYSEFQPRSIDMGASRLAASLARRGLVSCRSRLDTSFLSCLRFTAHQLVDMAINATSFDLLRLSCQHRRARCSHSATSNIQLTKTSARTT